MVRPLRLKRAFSPIIAFLILSSIIIGCSSSTQTDGETQEIPTPTPTLIPTTGPSRVVLAASGNIPPDEFSEAQTLIAGLAAGSGLEFEVRQEIFSNEITPDVKIVVFLEHPENLGSLAASSPKTQFVAVSDQNWSPPANGTIIRISEDHAAFLAGYMSALLAPNYRAGALLTSDDVQFNQAYNNGVQYFCGLCAAVIFPLNTYPVVSQLPAGSPTANWQVAFNEINVNKVNVLFLSPEAVSSELGVFLSEMDIALIGTQTPPEEMRSRWVATIESDGLSPIREFWNELVNGQGGKVVNASLKIADVNYMQLTDGLVWLSQGKMELLNKVITLLREDQIYPYSVIQ